MSRVGMMNVGRWSRSISDPDSLQNYTAINCVLSAHPSCAAAFIDEDLLITHHTHTGFILRASKTKYTSRLIKTHSEEFSDIISAVVDTDNSLIITYLIFNKTNISICLFI